MPKRLLIGIGLLIAVAAVIFVVTMSQDDSDDGTSSTGSTSNATPTVGPSPLPPMSTVTGLTGGEKIGFCRNENVTQLLAERYSLELDCIREGSIRMLEADSTGMDYLWPSNEVVLALYRERNPGSVRANNLFNSPIVLYSWDSVTEALMNTGIVEQRDTYYYVVDMPRLIDLVISGESWSSIGLSGFSGSVNISSTDPTESNSGNMFFGLLANLLVRQDTGDESALATDDTLSSVLPAIQAYRDKQGYMETSSGTLFNNFLSQGEGAYPIIVGYENQLIEFLLANEGQRDQILSRIRVLYPEPTVWSSHPMIALTDTGATLLNALEDPEVQQIAWRQHGLRSGLSGVQSNPADLNIPGIPETITAVIRLPSPSTMEMLINALD